MKIYIDCEWNGYQGDLISMALVPAHGEPFYEVLWFAGEPDSWITFNVLTKLGKPSLSYIVPVELPHKIAKFLSRFDAVHVIADWPEDIERFCKALIIGPGERVDTPPLTMEVVRIDTVSENPHNALADATALRDYYHANETIG